MGGALARAACQALGGEAVVVTNRTPAKAQALSDETGCRICGSNLEAAQAAEYMFLGVKPGQIKALLDQLRPALTPDKVVVSMAAGVTLEQMEGWTPPGQPILRVMPNTPCAIGMGMTALAGGSAAREEHYAAIERILSRSGRVERIEERLIDAFSAVAGCGPAFIYPYIEALADGGVAAGLPRAKAMTYAAQMTLGAAARVLESGEHPGALKDAVCSPGGSTIEGVAQLERHGLRAAAIDAVLAAWKKNAALGK